MVRAASPKKFSGWVVGDGLSLFSRALTCGAEGWSY